MCKLCSHVVVHKTVNCQALVDAGCHVTSSHEEAILTIAMDQILDENVPSVDVGFSSLADQAGLPITKPNK